MQQTCRVACRKNTQELHRVVVFIQLLQQHSNMLLKCFCVVMLLLCFSLQFDLSLDDKCLQLRGVAKKVTTVSEKMCDWPEGEITIGSILR